MKNLDALIEELSNPAYIKSSDIPDIDLYMDQVTTFIENKLGKEKRSKDDKLLTKTMINNYSKAKILSPSKNKKYNKHQMIQIILIYYLKQILSISDIENLFHPLFQIAEDNSEMVEEIYNTYLEGRKKNMGNVSSVLKEDLDLVSHIGVELDEEERNRIQLITAAMLMVSQAQAYKKTAEAIIDKYIKTTT